MMNITKESTGSDIVIRISQLQKKFGDFTAVDGLSFEIFRGEIFGFLGPNGAGKTTSINMICGLSPLTEGEIHIFEAIFLLSLYNP